MKILIIKELIYFKHSFQIIHKDKTMKNFYSKQKARLMIPSLQMLL